MDRWLGSKQNKSSLNTNGIYMPIYVYRIELYSQQNHFFNGNQKGFFK